MSIATVVIPASAEHYETGIYKEAVESVCNQTIPTKHIVIVDDSRNGAGWARNRGTARVQTPFVVYLDADDLLHPEFIERTIHAYQRGCFVYTNYKLNGEHVMTPPSNLEPQRIGMQHIITTLLPVAAWRTVGGFDERLNTLEDEDFYRRVNRAGWRGVHVPAALVEYRRYKGFSLVNKDTVDPDRVTEQIASKNALFKKRYEGCLAMDCINNPNRKKELQQALGERHDNDALYAADYSPRVIVGHVTKRSYPRAGFGQPIWVDKDDAQARPDLFQYIGEPPEKIAPDVDTVQRLAREALAKRKTENAFTDDEIAVEQAQPPNVDNMTRDEMLAYCEAHNVEVVGTGARNRVLISDLKSAIKGSQL